MYEDLKLLKAPAAQAARLSLRSVSNFERASRKGMLVIAALCLCSCQGEILGGNYDDHIGQADAGEAAELADASVPIAEEATVAVVGETAGKGHKLRKAPNSDSDLITFMPDYELLELLAEPEGNWWRVRYRGKEGWAHKNHLKAYASADEIPQAPEGFNVLLPWKNNTSRTVTQAHGGFSHDGISKWAWDFGMPVGTPVVAAHAGVVRRKRGNSTKSGCNSAFIYDANYVTIDRGDGLESHYVHLSKVGVAVGQQVKRGQRIGLSGQTGYSCGPHLHFQVQRSPSGGGTNAGANQSVHAYFWDSGTRWDPKAGASVTSRNNSADIP